MPELSGSGALLQSKGCTYSIRNHAVLNGTQGEDPQWAPSSPSLPYVCHKVKVSPLDAAIRNWKIAQIPSGAKDLDQLGVNKTWRRPIQSTTDGGSVFVASVRQE